jgi:hypothetical protein
LSYTTDNYVIPTEAGSYHKGNDFVSHIKALILLTGKAAVIADNNPANDETKRVVDLKLLGSLHYLRVATTDFAQVAISIRDLDNSANVFGVSFISLSSGLNLPMLIIYNTSQVWLKIRSNDGFDKIIGACILDNGTIVIVGSPGGSGWLSVNADNNNAYTVLKPTYTLPEWDNKHTFLPVKQIDPVSGKLVSIKGVYMYTGADLSYGALAVYQSGAYYYCVASMSTGLVVLSDN